MASNSTVNQTCFVFDKDEGTRISIQFVYEIPETKSRRKFNLLRSADESLSHTVRRLIANIEQVKKKNNKSKKNKNEETTSNNQEKVLIQLYDAQNELIDENLPNKQAWKMVSTLRVNQEKFHVEINAPAIVKFHFPEIIMSNTTTTAFVDIDYGEMKYSIFDWYITEHLQTAITADEPEDETIWTHVHRGHCCQFSDEHVNKRVRLLCTPRNSSNRSGMPAEYCSTNSIVSSRSDLPMIARHELTRDYFPIDSDLLRIVSYNLLANGYASSTDASDTLFQHCLPEYLDHNYRKPLLTREITNYHADIVCLQEVDTRFFERELTTILTSRGYLGEMKIKSDSVREGEAIFYRQDRFNLIDKHDITLGQYLRDSERMDSLRQSFSRLPQIYENLLERNTVLQILALNFIKTPNKILLICNTHLYFHPYADLLRCLQVIISLERIKEIKQFYEQKNKIVSVIWCGDFNANPTSLACRLLIDRRMVNDRNHRSFDADYSKLVENFDYESSLEFETYSNNLYTHYVPKFHDVIDHIFFERNSLNFQRSIPMPSHEQVIEFNGLPSCKMPSDHLAIVLELQYFA